MRGHVQGVGYRWFTRDTATAHNLTGWVRNRRDGSVEAELHGADAAVQAVLDAMALGPPGAQVDEVSATDVVTGASEGFEIRTTA